MNKSKLTITFFTFAIGGFLALFPAINTQARVMCCPPKDKCAPKPDKCAPQAQCQPKDKCGSCPDGLIETRKWW